MPIEWKHCYRAACHAGLGGQDGDEAGVGFDGAVIRGFGMRAQQPSVAGALLKARCNSVKNSSGIGFVGHEEALMRIQSQQAYLLIHFGVENRSQHRAEGRSLEAVQTVIHVLLGRKYFRGIQLVPHGFECRKPLIGFFK